jgi:hypothetical protein
VTWQKVPIFGMKRREFIRFVVAGTVAWPLAARAEQVKVPRNTATVRPLHEWSYENGPDYYLLRYLHEAWDNESTGFTIECRAGDKTTLSIGYTVMDNNYFNAYKRKRLRPKIEIRSVKGQITVDGELEEDGLFPAFAFSIPQSLSVDVLKILSGSNAVMIFPNRSYKLWQIKRSSEMSKFISACGRKVGRSAQ